jgi:hypothetical protein
MLKETIEPLRVIRAEADAVQSGLKHLRERFSQESMKDYAEAGLRDLRDMEVVFLQALDEDWRTIEQEAAQIRRARVPLELAKDKLRELKMAWDTRGAGAMLVYLQ